MDEKERIEKIIESEQMNASQFAEEIGIQGSTLSHILNGRNKPSLDVLKRVLNRFRLINSDWLILGVGSMYRAAGQSQQALLFDIKPENTSETDGYQEKSVENPIRNLPENRKSALTAIQPPSVKENVSEKQVTKVVVFYSDNTFEEIQK